MQEYNTKNVSGEVTTKKYLSFMSNGSEYAVDIQYITDIIKRQPVTFLPKLPEYIKGIINLRGKIIPIIDMRLRFGFESIEYSDLACVIVMEYEGTSVGILVDSVAEVSDINIENIMKPSKGNSSEHNRFISGISNQDGKVKLIINCMQIFEIE